MESSKTAFPPIVNTASKILLLGTMPGERSLFLKQYYGHGSNQFWRIMFNIYETPFSNDYEVRKQLLYNNNIALWDVLESCESIGSADNAIKNEKANDFKLFYQKYPAIKKVYFTSKAAEKYYDRYVLKSPDKSYFILPSPSRANTWKSFEEKLQEWNIIIH